MARPPATRTRPADQLVSLSASSARSSRGAARLPTALATRLSTQTLRPVHRSRADGGLELRMSPQAVRRPRLGEPVGVEHDRVARPQRRAALVQLRVRRQAEQRPRLADQLDAPVRPPQHRQRMAAAAHRQLRRPARQVDERAGDRAEAPARRLVVEHRLAHPLQDRRRRAPPRRRRPQRVARESGHGRRLGALAADVADHEVPLPLGGREDVVEVSADLEPLPRRVIRRGQLRAGHVRQVRRQQRRLQRLRDPRRRPVEPRVLHRGTRPQPEVLRHLHVLHVVDPLRGLQ